MACREWRLRLSDWIVFIRRALEAKYGVGSVPPEYRLHGAMVGCVLSPASLFWFGWAADARVYWPCPVVAAVPFAVGNIMVYSSGALYIMNSYGPTPWCPEICGLRRISTLYGADVFMLGNWLGE
ncbi:hypothetical protein NX059_012099 [Plenodomus lindquistii]|nr:hypothetical protein NX059_012099 [Plenodomus lindquistii]